MAGMKRAKENLMDSCGVDWFRRRVVGGHFVHEGKVLKISGVYDADKIDTVDISNERRVIIDKNVISGFSVFAYPELGYRRVKNVALWLSKIHSYDRGMRDKHLQSEYTPASMVLHRNLPGGAEANRRDIMTAALMPTFDGPADIKKVLDGDQYCAVLNPHVLIEPSNVQEDEHFNVFFRRRNIARLMPDGKMHYFKPQHEAVLRPLFGEGVIK